MLINKVPRLTKESKANTLVCVTDQGERGGIGGVKEGRRVTGRGERIRGKEMVDSILVIKN